MKLYMICSLFSVCNAGKTLLIAFDGIRWDYFNTAETPNFDRLIDRGAQVEKVSVAFPTVTFVNLYTLVTGLYAEGHGIVGNSFYDESYNDTFLYGTDPKWYNSTEHIMVTAEREGHKSGHYLWGGETKDFKGVTLSRQVPVSPGADFNLTVAIDKVTEWFVEDDLELVGLYHPEPDATGHRYGPDSEEVKAKVEELDGHIGYLLEKIEEAHLSAHLNIIIASDHGMTTAPLSNTVDMSQYLNYPEEIEWSFFDSVGLIQTKPGMTQQVFDKLSGASNNGEPFLVYKKEDVPDSLHYSDNERIPDIVVVVELGWNLLAQEDTPYLYRGDHGYDSKEEDMMTTFILYGPDFKCGHKQAAMKNVDLYPLLCKVLKLQTCHASDGRLSGSRGLLTDYSCHLNSPHSWIYNLFISIFGFVRDLCWRKY